MNAPSIGQNRTPGGDGDINLYIAPEGLGQPWFNPSGKVIFVNGMLNSPDAHRTAALALSVLQACPVLGVYNKSDGFGTDLVQCIKDKMTLTIEQSNYNIATWSKVVEAEFQKAKAGKPWLTKVNYVAEIIAGNKATLSLYFLMVNLGADLKNYKLFAHSQGNLITSNALTALALALGPQAIAGLEVNSYGSPCRNWPDGIRHRQFAFTFDPVTTLDGRVSFEISKVGFVGLVGIPANLDPMYSHAFLRYLEYDGEFVVNRFRWGSFGMTANMDEVGLAKFCVSLGLNTPRLTGIFKRLQTAQWSDSDDVAYEYVKRMREGHDGTMRQIKKNDPAFVQLLVDLLKAGWTTGGEQREIDYLQGL